MRYFMNKCISVYTYIIISGWIILSWTAINIYTAAKRMPFRRPYHLCSEEVEIKQHMTKFSNSTYINKTTLIFRMAPTFYLNSDLYVAS